MQTQLADISHVIQLAIAPVFLLTAVATMINAMNTRLGRIVDLFRNVWGCASGIVGLHGSRRVVSRRAAGCGNFA